jgi:hypothetical protein
LEWQRNLSGYRRLQLELVEALKPVNLVGHMGKQKAVKKIGELWE